MKGVGQMARVWAVVAILGLSAALAGACGGGGEPQADASPTPTEGDATLAPCQALQALKSYRYSAKLKVESPEPTEGPAQSQPTPTSTLTREFTGPFLFDYAIDASFVAPDRIEALITTGSEEPFAMIAIGGQGWIQLGDKWKTAEQPVEIPYTPADVCDAILPDLDLSQVQPQEEEIDDVKSLHYSFSQVSSPEAMAKIFGQGSDMDILIKTLDVEVWLAEKDGWPARMNVGGSGLYADGRELRVHLAIDIRDANSGDIRVEPPL